MWSFLVTPEFQPFTIAALVMIGVLAIEIASGLLGASVSTLLDTLFGLHGVHVDSALHHGPDVSDPTSTGFAAHHGMPHGMTGPFGTAFDWLNAGRVPLLILIMAATACFAVFGMVLQIVAMHLAAPLPPTIAAVFAIAAAVPGTRWTSRVVTWLVPRDETYALTNEDLIGRVGIVTLGPVVAGAAARAKVQDKYGNWHFPRIAAGAAGVSIPEGASVLIVDKVGGEYTVIEAEGRLVSTKEQSR